MTETRLTQKSPKPLKRRDELIAEPTQSWGSAEVLCAKVLCAKNREHRCGCSGCRSMGTITLKRWKCHEALWCMSVLGELYQWTSCRNTESRHCANYPKVAGWLS